MTFIDALAAIPAATWIALVATAFVAGCSRGFSGFGAALIFIPLASAIVGPRLASPVLLLIDAVAAAPLVPRAWRLAHRRDVGVMAMGTLLGVPLGTWLLARADPVAVRWVMAALVFAMLALLMSGWRLRGRVPLPATVGVGAVGGTFSGLAQMGGPAVVAYWLGRDVEPGAMRANIVLLFGISGAITFVSYLAGGLLSADAVVLALGTGPAYGTGLALGARLFGLADPRVFRRICYGLIACAAIGSLPVWDGLVR